MIRLFTTTCFIPAAAAASKPGAASSKTRHLRDPSRRHPTHRVEKLFAQRALQSGLLHRALPGAEMQGHGIDEGAVAIEM